MKIKLLKAMVRKMSEGYADPHGTAEVLQHEALFAKQDSVSADVAGYKIPACWKSKYDPVPLVAGHCGSFDRVKGHYVHKLRAVVSGIDTLAIDTAKDRDDFDLRKLETPDDSSTYGVWFSPKWWEIISYDDGDVCIETYHMPDAFYAGLGHHCDFHGIPVGSVLKKQEAAARTDPHRPSVIVPADYDFVGHYPTMQANQGAFNDLPFVEQQHKVITDHMEKTGGVYSTHRHGGICHICGAYAGNLAVWHHRPTNDYIMTGETCSEHFDDFDGAAFRRMARQADNAREFATGLARRAVLLEEQGLTHALESEDHIVCEMMGKLRRYGDLSEKQWGFVRLLLEREAQQNERQAQYDAEREAAAPIPSFDGRVTVEMAVVSIKDPDDGAEFPAYKLVLKHADGWMLYGTRPSALRDVERGDTVKFDARIKVSDRDPKFGFYSRPTKATIETKKETSDADERRK